jgi:hypothetical protein
VSSEHRYETDHGGGGDGDPAHRRGGLDVPAVGARQHDGADDRRSPAHHGAQRDCCGSRDQKSK